MKYIVILAIVVAAPSAATQLCRKTVVRAAQSSVPLPVDVATTFSQSPQAPLADTYFILDGQLFAHQMISDGPGSEEIYTARRKVYVSDATSNRALLLRWKSVSVVRSAASLLPVLALLADNGEAYLCRPSQLPPDFYATGERPRIASHEELEDRLLSQFIAHRLPHQFMNRQQLPVDRIKLAVDDDDTFRVGITAVFGILYQSDPIPLSEFAKGMFKQTIALERFAETRGTLDFVLLPYGGAVLLTSDPAVIYLDALGREYDRFVFSPEQDVGTTVAAAQLPTLAGYGGQPAVRSYVFLSENDRQTLMVMEPGFNPRPVSRLPAGDEPLSLSYAIAAAPLLVQEDRGVSYEILDGNVYKNRLVVVTKHRMEGGAVYRFLAHQEVEDRWLWQPLPWNPHLR